MKGRRGIKILIKSALCPLRPLRYKEFKSRTLLNLMALGRSPLGLGREQNIVLTSCVKYATM